MLSTLVVLALAAEPAVAPPVTLALPGLNAVNLKPGEGDLYAELIAQKFIEHGVKVMTARDLSSILGMERQKQLLGCSDEGCVVEMTAALGADGVLVGDLGKLGDDYALNLKVLSSKNGEPLALHNARALNSHGLDIVIENSVRAILAELSKKLKRPELAANTAPIVEAPPVAVSTGLSPLRKAAIGVGAVGVVGLGAGAVLQVMAGGKYTELTSGPKSVPDAAALRDSGVGMQTGGNIALIGGGVALAAAVVMFLMGGGEATPTVALFPGGASVGFAGVLP